MMKAIYGLLVSFFLAIYITAGAAQLTECNSDDCQAYFKKFKTNADRGHDKAIAMVGEFYYHGYGIKKDIDKALRYYKKAAKRGITSAKYKAGLVYLINKQHQDTKKGIWFLKKAASTNYKEANFLLGRIHLTEEFGVKDYATADYYLARAYHQEHKDIPFTVSYIVKEFGAEHEVLFPLINQEYEQKPLLLRDRQLVWPHQNVEKITVTSNQLSSLLDTQLTDFRSPKKSLGSRLPTISCQETAGCYHLNSMRELADFVF